MSIDLLWVLLMSLKHLPFWQPIVVIRNQLKLSVITVN